jgi:hypothetical protein
MRTREIPPEISELLPAQDDVAFLRLFVANEVPASGRDVDFALKNALSVGRRVRRAAPCYRPPTGPSPTVDNL